MWNEQKSVQFKTVMVTLFVLSYVFFAYVTYVSLTTHTIEILVSK